MSYCYGTSDVTDNTPHIAKRKTGGKPARLVCLGRDSEGVVTIKGLSLDPSLVEAFSICLIEAPTCLCVAIRRPMIATGYTDGTVTVTSFTKDRYELKLSARRDNAIYEKYVIDSALA